VTDSAAGLAHTVLSLAVAFVTRVAVLLQRRLPAERNTMIETPASLDQSLDQHLLHLVTRGPIERRNRQHLRVKSLARPGGASH
jgi:hypothetical protein